MDRWQRIRAGEADLNVADRRRRAEEGKLVTDRSESTQVVEVFIESCRAAGIVANSRAKKALLQSSFDLAHAALGRAGVAALGLALQINTVVTHLDLRDNDIDELGFTALMHGLMDNASVKVLNVSDNPGPGKRGMEAMCAVLEPARRKHPTIAELCLQRCNITSAQGAALFKSLGRNKSVQTLDVSRNNLGAETARSMLENFLEQNMTCHTLKLSHNVFKHASAKDIAEGASSSISLRRLALDNNGLEEEGCMHIAEMLATNSSLEELDLSRTRMGPAAGLAVAASLEKNETLRKLHLRDNPLGERVGRMLLDALGKNEKKNLEVISLEGAQLNSAQADVAEALAQREVDRKAAEASKGGGKKKKSGAGGGKKGAAAAPPAPPPPSKSKFVPEDFDPLHPDGRYALNLGVPAEFSVASQLLRLEDAMPG